MASVGGRHENDRPYDIEEEFQGHHGLQRRHTGPQGGGREDPGERHEGRRHREG